MIDAKGDFTQANSFLLPARIIKKLFKCQKHLKTHFFACFNYNKGIVQMLQAFKTQFLACLLALLAGWLRFRLVVSLVGLTVALATSKAVIISRKVAISFSKCFLWKKLISFFRC